jgi:hypothetical protein
MKNFIRHPMTTRSRLNKQSEPSSPEGSSEVISPIGSEPSSHLGSDDSTPLSDFAGSELVQPVLALGSEAVLEYPDPIWDGLTLGIEDNFSNHHFQTKYWADPDLYDVGSWTCMDLMDLARPFQVPLGIETVHEKIILATPQESKVETVKNPIDAAVHFNDNDLSLDAFLDSIFVDDTPLAHSTNHGLKKDENKAQDREKKEQPQPPKETKPLTPAFEKSTERKTSFIAQRTRSQNKLNPITRAADLSFKRI